MMGQRLDESFLLLIIAIEQVFSEREKTTQAVASRTAIAASRALISTTPQPRSTSPLSMMFGADSCTKANLRQCLRGFRYSYHGDNPTEDRQAANALGEAVIRCLIRLCLLPGAEEEGFHERWLKRLDYLVAGIEAGKAPSDSELAENGLIEPVPEPSL